MSRSAKLLAIQHHRQAVLTVYRKCLQSADRIPDPSQRSMYWDYIRHGFRSSRHVSNPTRALTDAQEQLERMDYYHSIREQKEKEAAADSVSITNNLDQTSSLPSSVTKSPERTDDTTTEILHEKDDPTMIMVQTWIQQALPHLSMPELQSYAQELISLGFDSEELLRHDLQEDDLHFMKPAHQRAILRVHHLSA